MYEPQPGVRLILGGRLDSTRDPRKLKGLGGPNADGQTRMHSAAAVVVGVNGEPATPRTCQRRGLPGLINLHRPTTPE